MSSQAASLKASGDSGRVTTPPHPRLWCRSWYRGRFRESLSSDLRALGLQHRIHRAPAVPGRDGAVRSKAFALRLESTRSRKVREFVSAGPALTNPVVVDRPNVKAAQLEDEEHLGGPSPDASYLHQACHQLIVR